MMQNQRPIFRNLFGVTCGIVALGAVSSALGQGVATFQGLGDLPGGAFKSIAYGVSSDGSVVVGFGTSGTGVEAFRWTQVSGMLSIGTLPGSTSSKGLAVSGDGTVVVGLSGIETFRWTQAGMVGLGTLMGSGFSYGTGVSANGDVVVGPATYEFRAFRWTQRGGMVDLGVLDDVVESPLTGASAVSADGSVVVGFGTILAGREAFRWVEADPQGPMQGLGDLPGGSVFSEAAGISEDGSVVVGFGTSANGPNGADSEEAFRWTQATGMIGLGDLPGGIFASEAFAVSANGSVVVGYGTSPCGQEAFIWDSNAQMRRLRSVLLDDFGLATELTGWTLTSARAISADGKVIVGGGTNPQGDSEAWRAFLPFSPCCSDGGVCMFNQCVGGVCQESPKPYGDVDHDGNVGLSDLFCVLDGFACKFDTCSFAADDVEPCEGNGTINMFDICAVLDAFAGIDPCCGGGGQPATGGGSPLVGGTVTLSLRPKQSVLSAGGDYVVDVVAAGFVDLRGYQIVLGATGGSAGRLDLEQVYIDTGRTDHVFAGRKSYDAVDEGNGRTACVLSSGGVDSQTPVYLATFVFRASSDAVGTFAVSAPPDRDTAAGDSAGTRMTVVMASDAQITIP